MRRQLISSKKSSATSLSRPQNPSLPAPPSSWSTAPSFTLRTTHSLHQPSSDSLPACSSCLRGVKSEIRRAAVERIPARSASKRVSGSLAGASCLYAGKFPSAVPLTTKAQRSRSVCENQTYEAVLQQGCVEIDGKRMLRISRGRLTATKGIGAPPDQMPSNFFICRHERVFATSALVSPPRRAWRTP